MGELSLKIDPKRHDLFGKSFGYLTVVAYYGSRGKGAIWRCLCDCGKEVIARGARLSAGDYLSCGCQCPGRRGGNKHPKWTGYGEISGTYWKNLLRGAFTRDIPMNITITYIWDIFLAQERKCSLSGLPISFGSHKESIDETASLDRINSNVGYEEGNVQWVHKSINKMKMDLPERDFIEFCRLVTQKKGG